MMKKRLLRLFSIFLCLILMVSTAPAAPAAELAEEGLPHITVRVFTGDIISNASTMARPADIIKSLYTGTIKTCRKRVIDTVVYPTNRYQGLQSITVENTQLLIIMCPEQDLTSYVGNIRSYMQKGGCVWICGEFDDSFHSINEKVAALSKGLGVQYMLGSDSVGKPNENIMANLDTSTELGRHNDFGEYDQVLLGNANSINGYRVNSIPIITLAGKTYMIDTRVERGYLTVSADGNLLERNGITPWAAQILYNMLDRSYTEIQKNSLPHEPPAALDLTYNGEEQTLVKPGVVDTDKGIMKYSLDGMDWSETLPVGEKAGTYPVSWKIDVTAEGYGNIGPETINVEIKKAIPTYTEPSGQELTYTGKDQMLGMLGSVTGGTMWYSLDGASWSMDFPSGLEAGTYTIHWKITGDENHSDVTGTFVESVITAEPKPEPEPEPVLPSSGSEPGYPVKITDRTPPGGSVKTSRNSAKDRETVFITATPIAGHQVQTVSVVDKNGNALSVEDLGGGRYSFKMARGWVEVSATFAGITASGRNDGASAPAGFPDVSAGAWYYDGVQYCLESGLMGGSGGVFLPDARISRAAFTAILWRMSGSPVTGGTLPFEDVAETDWCAGAVRWAAAEGLVNGYDGRFFGAGDPLSREQLAAILWRYAQHEGMDVRVPEGDVLSSFADAGSISAYARPAMEWACSAGLINGQSREGVQVLEPRETGSRAQTAAIIARYARRAEGRSPV